MTPTQRAALLALAEAGEQAEEPVELRGTGWVAGFERRRPGELWPVARCWALTPAGRGAVEAVRAGARVEPEPMQRALPLGQRRLL